MFNQAQSILDQLLSATPRAGADSADAPTANGGAGNPSQQGGGFELGQLLNGKAGLATGVVAGGLIGLLLGNKKVRKLATPALQLGGAAVVGGLAYKAWRDWQAQKAVPAATASVTLPSPEGTPFMPQAAAAVNDLSVRLLQAMLAAAKADGHVTDAERARITSHLGSLGIGPEAREFIEQELARPLDIAAVAALARTPEEAAEIYAASLLVVDPEAPAERGYLALLAARLQLDPGLVAHLHANAAAVTT